MIYPPEYRLKEAKKRNASVPKTEITEVISLSESNCIVNFSFGEEIKVIRKGFVFQQYFVMHIGNVDYLIPVRLR